MAGTSGSTAGSGGTTGTARDDGRPDGRRGRGHPRDRAARAGTGSVTGTGSGGHDRHGRDRQGNPGPTRNFPGEAQGFWRFDDCNMDRTELFDSSFFGTTRRTARSRPSAGRAS